MGERLARFFVEPSREPAEAVRSAQPAPEALSEPVHWLPPVVARPGAGNGVGALPTSRSAEPGLLRAAVLCAPADVRLAGGAVGLGLAHGRGGPAVVLEWTGRELAPARDRASSGAARRLAVTLREEGHAAASSGRLVRVALPQGEADAVDTARAVEHAAGDAPGLVVVGGPRGEVLEGLVASCPLVILALRADTDEALAEIALGSLLACGRPVDRLDLPSAAGAAVLARSGTGLTGPLRGPVLGVLGAG
jgi:hypothetical protein